VGVFDKVKFWKKDDDFGVPGSDGPQYDLGAPGRDDPLSHQDPLAANDPLAPDPSAGFPQQYPSYPQSTPFPGSANPQRQVPQEQYPQQDQGYGQDHTPEHHGVQQRDVELILAKLDGLKSELDALHQRVKKIEQATDTQASAQQQQRKYW